MLRAAKGDSFSSDKVIIERAILFSLFLAGLVSASCMLDMVLTKAGLTMMDAL